MAAPQKENGFTAVANEILDEICQYKFNGSQLRIIMKVWRLTYGYSRKDHEFARTFLQEVTGLSESTVKTEVTALIKNKVLIVTQKETSTDGRKLAFNKNYEEWTIQKSGESMTEQLDLFGGQDSTPQDDQGRGLGFHPSEGYDSTPPSSVSGGAFPPLYKEKDLSLNKSIKEKEMMFETFYSLYPRKIAKPYAKTIWIRKCKDETFDPDLVITNTKHFADTCILLKTKTSYIPHPSTYINQKKYEDYPRVDPEGLAAVGQSKLGSTMDFLQQQIGGGFGGQEASGLTLREGGERLPE
ncbi:phage replication protein O [Paenibacillus algorifonticola]|uniref:Phage replication protein O n=1 Tax=Paenibacillus algorifonticola TaxID=684063 RepID=A0A1I2AEZ9_9BACL|nr:replication protein [Paenibacillus algorifonticola]SFE42594.1 phage replication protein O [Paenibacillus algorifonticola]